VRARLEVRRQAAGEVIGARRTHHCHCPRKRAIQ
jgi:hypothetical protein